MPTDELSSLREELKDINKRLQQAETSIKVSDVTRTERHTHMIEKIERLDQRLNLLEEQLATDMDKLYKKIDALQNLALQGKTSLKTLWLIGGVVSAGLGILATWLQVFK